MSKKPIKVHVPCPDCSSSDALSVYEDHSYCFSCQKYTKLGVDKSENVSTFPLKSGENSFITKNNKAKPLTVHKFVEWRKVTKETMQFFNVGTDVTEQGVPLSINYVYPNGAVKIRTLADKNFFSEGPMSEAGLFGRDRFSPGSSKAITITEGELDCLSVYQMMGSRYPTVSVRSATQAKTDCERDYKYIDSFEKIYLAFDNDKAGSEAAKQVALLFDPNKVYIVEFGDGLKDGNDYLTQGKSEEFVKCWWNAKRFMPKGIVNSYSEVKDILSRTSSTSICTYPFPTLNDMAYGIREGEVILFTALEKVGKTEIIRAIEHHLLKNTDENIGIIHLEEEEKRSIQGLLSYELDVPCHLPDSGVSLDDQLKAYERLTTRDSRLHFYTHFGSDDPNTILSVVRYLVVTCKCKFIFLDHITMLVTGFEGDDERKKLDYLSTRLAMLTRELKFTLFIVSHVNDHGQTRGSRNISKVADLIIHLNRDPEAASFDGRNTTELIVKGNRFAAKSGPAGYLRFDPSTYKIKELANNDVTVEMNINDVF